MTSNVSFSEYVQCPNCERYFPGHKFMTEHNFRCGNGLAFGGAREYAMSLSQEELNEIKAKAAFVESRLTLCELTFADALNGFRLFCDNSNMASDCEEYLEFSFVAWLAGNYNL